MLRFVLAFIAVAAVARADDPNPVEWWDRVVRAKNVVEIAKLMETEGSPVWPEVKSIRQVQDDKISAKIALVNALHEKLKQSFDADDATRENVRAYVIISTSLQNSGGYSNVLLAECFNRIVLFRITGWLIENKQPLDEIKALFSTWRVPSAGEPKTWLTQFQDDDPTVKAVRNNFENLKPGMAFGPSIIGMQPLDLDAAKRENQTFTKLMKQPSVLLLISRFAETEIAKVVCLRGFISFAEKGGKLEELDERDIRAFKRRMGEDIYEFKYPPTGHRRLSVSDIKFAYRIHDDPKLKTDILNLALK